jgi:hypothetical protein
MTRHRKYFILTLAALLAAVAPLRAQQPFTPHIAYVFPAGGRQGASFQVEVAGQYLGNVTNACISGQGVQAVVVDCVKPLTQQQVAQLREQLKQLRDKRDAAQKPRAGGATNAVPTRPSWTAADMRTAADIREKLAQFQKKSANPVMADVATLKITISSNAEPGQRELRLGTPTALSQPLVFCVGQLAEFNKPAPSEASAFPAANRPPNANGQIASAPVESRISLPCSVNGQIMPGGVDRYRFQARKGQRLVFAAMARELVPYLADAVPGWFQALLSLYDPQGREVACADHFRFHPDPVLFYEVPKDGEYVLQIRDSIYRGRDDFVYRITAGELPFLTGIFPLGGPAGARTTISLSGWNLPAATLTEDDTAIAPGIYPLSVRTKEYVSNHLPFAVDTLPECFSRRLHYSRSTAQPVTLPVIVNGRIDQPGQWDVFRFEGRAGQEIVAEVIARRLDSPLDSVLKLTDAAGQQLAFNDDFEDKGAGLQTHYADSYLRFTLPATASYYLFLGDAQHQGGPEFAYRLRLSPPRPDFALRVVPSSLAVRGGMAVPFTVYALRRDGFSNEITLALKDAPPGFTLSGGTVLANQNQVRLTLTAPALPSRQIFNLAVEGRALIQEHEVIRPGVPAQDMMQAFAYWHLVPSQELEVSVLDRPQFRRSLSLLDPTPVKIPAGGTAQVRVRTPGPAFTTNFQLELNEPPDGISIASVSQADAETEIVLHSDAAKIKPGVKGNLIVNIIAARPRAAAAGKPRANQPRPALGALPAIPFEVVAPN